MKIEMINEAKVRHYLSKEKILAHGTKFELVELLAKTYGSQKGQNVSMALCTECECFAPSTLPECPFCGDDTEVTQNYQIDDNVPRNELEGACNVIISSMKAASQNIYNVGKAIVCIVEDKLWRQKLGEDGKPLYDGPYSCIEAECGMKKKSAQRLAAVVKSYDQNAFEEHGITRLNISMQLPEKKRRGFLERAKLENTKQGPEDRALVNEILSGKEESINIDEDTEEITVKKGSPRPPQTTAKVRFKLGVTTIPMMKRPTVRSKRDEPATSLRDFPWCDVHVGGDIFLGLRFTRNEKHEIVAVVEFKTVQKSSGSGILSMRG